MSDSTTSDLERVRKAFFKAKRAFADIAKRRWQLMSKQGDKADSDEAERIKRALKDL